MSTKYPLNFDDVTTLGPTFIDVAPPTDPQRNIAAEFRNNINDAMEAVQIRVGKLDDPNVASIDWGLLSVAGIPNQGLRFAGTHATWPGVIAEDGIFVDSGTGNAAFHKSGDPLATFTDLTGGGGASTWDAIYAVDKTLDISSTVLTFTQSTGTGTGFQVDRNRAVSTAPTVRMENVNAADDQPALSLGTLGSDTLYIDHPYDTTDYAIRCYDTTNATDRFAVKANGEVDETYEFASITAETVQHDIISASPAVGLGLGGIAVQQKLSYRPAVADNANSMIVGSWYEMSAAPTNNSGVAIIIGDPASGTSNWGQGIRCSALDNYFQHKGTVSGPTYMLRTYINPSNVLAALDHVYGIRSSLDGNAGDDPLSIFKGCSVQLGSPTGGTSTAYSVEGAVWDVALKSESGTFDIDGNDATDLVSIGQAGAGNLLRLVDGTLAVGTNRYVFDTDGKSVRTPAIPTAAFESSTITITSGGINGTGLVGVVNHQSEITGSAGDTNNAVMCGYKAEYTDGGGASLPIGFWASNTSGFGLLSTAQVNITMSAASPALWVDQSGAGASLRLLKSTVNIFNVGVDGDIDHTPSDDTQAYDIDASVTNVAGDFVTVSVDPLHSVDLTQSGKDITGVRSTVYGRAGDTSVGTAYHLGFEAVFSGTAPTDLDVACVGYRAQSGFSWGLISESPTLLAVDTSIAPSYPVVLAVADTSGSGTRPLLECWDGLPGSGSLRTRIRRNGETTIETDAAVASPALTITQNDLNEAFINYEGSAATSDYLTNVSDLNGDGSVTGPQNKSANPGWTYVGMVKKKVNGSDYWMPYYTPDP